MTAVSANGCPATVTKQNYIHIKYNPKPMITSGSITGCNPHYIALFTTWNPKFSYQWSHGDSSANVNTFASYHTYQNPGNYIPTITVNYNNGCVNSALLDHITVYPSPVVQFGISNYIGCAPLNVILTNSTTGNNTYLWDFGDGNTSTQFLPNYSYTTQGSYHISLQATSANGCVEGHPLNLNIIVEAPEAIFNPDVTSGCPPLTVNFTDHSNAATSWHWDFGDGTTSTAQHPTHIYNNIGLYIPKLIAYSGTGCSDTLIYPIAINVNAPVVNYISPAPIIGCAPFSATVRHRSRGHDLSFWQHAQPMH